MDSLFLRWYVEANKGLDMSNAEHVEIGDESLVKTKHQVNLKMERLTGVMSL